MKQYWWSSTAYHIWRAYFAMSRVGAQSDSPANQKKYNLCHPIFLSLSDRDQRIIRAFFTAEWGNPIRTVEDYSLRSGIPTQDIYATVAKVSRAVIEADTLIDKRDLSKGVEYK